ncbi:MAG: phosphodiester glycosidase family protein [Chloroflexi bacterium]|nr:phosphodiester glycosidase family protein [Chloroflexota bacterium]
MVPFVLFVAGVCAGAYLVYNRGCSSPLPTKQTFYEGVVYRRMVSVVPRPMIAHIITIDRRTADIAFLVTPPDREGDLPLDARTTSRFLDEFNVQIAVNGDGFEPWWSRSPVDYYPHEGDPVVTLGFTASNGVIYSQGRSNDQWIEPTLYITRTNYPSFSRRRPDRVWSAISGDRMLVNGGQVESGLDDKILEPRTAIGISGNGRFVYLVVVDGRQPFCSEGATFRELAQILLDHGAFFAMSLDGGGSSTMVIEGESGEPVVLNSPIDNYIPGRERPVANHLGIYVYP